MGCLSIRVIRLVLKSPPRLPPDTPSSPGALREAICYSYSVSFGLSQRGQVNFAVLAYLSAFAPPNPERRDGDTNAYRAENRSLSDGNQ